MVAKLLNLAHSHPCMVTCTHKQGGGPPATNNPNNNNNKNNDNDGDGDGGGFMGSGLSTREAVITTLGITPVTLLLAVAALGMAGLNALNGPGWLRPSLGMKPTTFQSRNLVLPLDQEGMLFPPSVASTRGEKGVVDVAAAWERE
jgi:hypothetical protein